MIIDEPKAQFGMVHDAIVLVAGMDGEAECLDQPVDHCGGVAVAECRVEARRFVVQSMSISLAWMPGLV